MSVFKIHIVANSSKVACKHVIQRIINYYKPLMTIINHWWFITIGSIYYHKHMFRMIVKHLFIPLPAPYWACRTHPRDSPEHRRSCDHCWQRVWIWLSLSKLGYHQTPLLKSAWSHCWHGYFSAYSHLRLELGIWILFHPGVPNFQGPSMKLEDGPLLGPPEDHAWRLPKRECLLVLQSFSFIIIFASSCSHYCCLHPVKPAQRVGSQFVGLFACFQDTKSSTPASSRKGPCPIADGSQFHPTFSAEQPGLLCQSWLIMAVILSGMIITIVVHCG